jgi:hypothetical protein
LGGVTAALFGVGLYTDRRWKIHTTSHGLLVIAALLVPLNFLAIAAFTQGVAANDAVTLVGEAASAVVFTLLVYLAGRIIAPGNAVPLVLGVMVPSLVQLVVRRWAEPASSPTMLYALATVPVACYVATTSIAVRRRAAEFDEADANRLLAFLGVVSAATFFPLALLAWLSRPIDDVVHRLSPLVVWCGVPALVTGLVFWRRMTDRRLGGMQTAGVAVGVLGAAIMGGALVAAWPDPATLLPTALMNVVAFAVVAIWFGIPAALVPAGVALVAAWLVGFHLARGNVDWTLADYAPMSRALISATSGQALVPLVAVFGILIGMLRRVGRREEGAMVALVAAATAAASLALVMWFGFARAGDPEGATWTLAIYAVAALAAAAVADRAVLAWAASALALAAIIQAVVYRYGEGWQLERPWVAALLAHASLMVVVASALRVARRQQALSLRAALSLSALPTSVAAAGLVLAWIGDASSAVVVAYLVWLAAVFAAIAASVAWPVLFMIGQLCLLLAGYVTAVAAMNGPWATTDALHRAGVGGWIALAAIVASCIWRAGRRALRLEVVALFAAAAAMLATHSAGRWDGGTWTAFHTLLVMCCVAAWLVPVIGERANGRWTAVPVRLFGIAAVVLAFRALAGDPAAPWWTIGALAAIAVRNLWIAWYERDRESMWVAAALCNLAVSVWWIDQGHQLTATRGRGEPVEFVWVNAIAVALIAVVSVWVECRASARLENARGVAFHRFAAWAIVGMLLLTTTGRLVGDLGGSFIEASAVMGWTTWLAALAAAVACWWDPRSRWPVACLYLVGLVAVGMYLDGLNFTAPMFHWALAMALAAYSLATSFLWSRRREIATVLTQLRVPLESDDFTTGGGQHWLVAVNGLSAVAVVALVAWIEVVMPEFRQRMVAAYAIGAEALALALLARGVVRSSLQYASLVLGTLFAVAFAWAWLAPEMPAPWLHRTVAAIVALAVTIVVYGFGFAKLLRRENEWTRAAERLVPLLAVIAAALLLVVLTIETVAFAEGRAVPITWPALLAVLVALVGLAAAALVAALVPGRDPLGLSERGRTAYVYAAEALLALAFLHIRVTMPWLFSGWFMRFWPMVVMAIAFVGVGVGELFHRLQRRVLAEPLTNTGVLLPLLPALGFWVTSSEVHYSLLLLTVGVLYAAMSALRQSFWFAVLAAVAANGSLWYLLHEREGLGLAEHPQLWLIPPALCVLVAGYLNRERLAPEQSAAMRYGAAIVIYASSTADIFINGVADAPWLPAVLAGLSIVGVFAGILLRVRAFLYLGVTFLAVAIVTVIWYAAIEQQRTWILWVAGIVTGIAIIALFGVFEKRRYDVLRVVERLRQWER